MKENLDKTSLNQQQKESEIQILRNKIIGVLEIKREITLAQLPHILKKMYNYQYNLQQLGYQKLKTFLQQMNQIKLVQIDEINYTIKLI